MDEQELQEGDFYWSEEGFRVFTEQYHLRRGYCCMNNCRHCPYKKKENTNKINRDGDQKF